MTNDSSIPIENLDPETLKAPVSALKNPEALRQAHNEMSRRDEKRAWLRSRHQALLDGAPPFDHATLVANGQGGRTNVDWGDAKAAMNTVMTGQIDMIMSVENLVRVPHKRYAIPDDEVRTNMDNILSREVSRAIRNWENFTQRMLSLGQYTFGHGVGFAYFEDANTWQPEVAYLGDFLIPDGTKASEGDIPIATCYRSIELHKLYGYIRDEAAAKEMGWNVEAVKMAMTKAYPENQAGDGNMAARWMKIEEDMRANALGTSYGGKTAKVHLIHGWVQEFDGTVTKYITTKDKSVGNDEKENFLFERKKHFDEMQQGFVAFTNGVGDHGTFHSISGLLRSIYPQCQALNRAQCTMLDAAVMSAGIPIQPKTDASITRMKIGSIGGLMPVMPSEEHGTILQRVVPNVSQNVMPLVSDFRNTINNRAGSFQGTTPFQGAVERTRTEVLATMESLSKVSTTQTSLWYPPFGRLLREMVRRLCRPSYSESLPGGKEAAKFRRRLKEAGYPLELLEQIEFDDIIAERAIGAGSASSRVGKLVQLKEMAPEFDAVGKQNLVRDVAAAILDGDYSLADRYAPAVEVSRPPIDAQFAELENFQISQGVEPVIQVNQNHLVHVQIHTKYLGEIVQSVESGQQDMDGVVEQMVIAHDHATAHLEQIQESVINQQEVAQYRQMLQQLGEIVNQALQKAIAKRQKEAADAQEAQMNGEHEQGMENSPELQQKMIESRLRLQSIAEENAVKLRFAQEKHQQEMAQKAEKARQEMALTDARTAATIAADMRKQSAELRAKVAIHKQLPKKSA